MEFWRKLAEDKEAATQAVQTYKEAKKEVKIRKGLSREAAAEFFKPVTQKLEEIPKEIAAAMEEPEESETPEEPMSVAKPKTMGGIDVNMYDSEIQLKDSALSNTGKIKIINEYNRMLGRLKNNPGVDKKYIEDIQLRNSQYRERLKKFGRGTYKVGEDGEFGDLVIDLPELFNHHLLASNGMDEKIDDDFIELITKRFNPKKKYSDLSKRVFKQLVDASNIPPNKSSGKYSLCVCDPEKLADRLELIVGSLDAGNNNEELINEGIMILDELLNMGEITKEIHEELYRMYFTPMVQNHSQ